MSRNIRKVTMREVWDYVTEVLDIKEGDKIRVRRKYNAYVEEGEPSKIGYTDKYYIVGEDAYFDGEYELLDNGDFKLIRNDTTSFDILLDMDSEVTKLARTKEEVMRDISAAIDEYNDGWEPDWNSDNTKFIISWGHRAGTVFFLSVTSTEIPGAIYVQPGRQEALRKKFKPEEWAMYLGVDFNK